jgi:tetratricopeptide (TPR) repeat protein
MSDTGIETAQAHYRSAMACCEQGRIAEGIELARKSLALDPGQARTHRLLGTAFLHAGQGTDALASFERAIALAPESAPAHGGRADALSALGRLPEAVESYDRALALRPDSVEDWCNRGAALFELGRYEEAIRNCDRIIEIEPRFAQAHFNRANALARLGRHGEAIAGYDQALAIDSRFADAHNNRANVVDAIGRPDDALLGLDRALAADPAHRGALISRARILNRHGRAAQALESCDRALASFPRDFDALSARGEALINLDRLEEAIGALDRAIAIDPGAVKARWNKSLLCLGLGHLAEGWALYEHRWAAAKGLVPRPYRQPRWNGQALDGTLLLWSEQGLGDEILHSSMLPDLAGRARKIVLEVSPRLVPLFARSFASVEVVAQRDALYSGPVDAQAALGGLGQIVRPGFEAFPRRSQGYLGADAGRAGQLRARLAADRRAVIGLSWISRAPASGEAKSAKLADFASLLRLPGCRFVDLQYGDTTAERLAVQRDLDVEVERIGEIDNMNDIDGLAALITACDLVVTVSNTTAHLAGALGQPTWVMVPHGFARMWYWHRDRLDSPWYPRLRVRRQARDEPWADLATAVAQEVAAFMDTELSAPAHLPDGSSR